MSVNCMFNLKRKNIIQNNKQKDKKYIFEQQSHIMAYEQMITYVNIQC